MVETNSKYTFLIVERGEKIERGVKVQTRIWNLKEVVAKSA